MPASCQRANGFANKRCGSVWTTGRELGQLHTQDVVDGNQCGPVQRGLRRLESRRPGSKPGGGANNPQVRLLLTLGSSQSGFGDDVNRDASTQKHRGVNVTDGTWRELTW